MNNLSWLLYWADVLPELSTAISCIGMLFLIIGGTIYTLLSAFDDEVNLGGKRLRRIIGWLLVVVLPSLFIAQLIPSRKTMYLIAGSEMGQKIVETPEFAKVRKVVNNFLDEQLKDKTVKEEEK